jgi:small subunit ribosomal protein S1
LRFALNGPIMPLIWAPAARPPLMELASASMSKQDEQPNPMEELLDQQLSCRPLRPRQVVPGVVVDINPAGLVVDVGAKCEGFVARDDFERLAADEREAIEVGTEVLAYVIQPGEGGEDVILSLSRAQAARDWVTAQELLDSGETLEEQAVDCNKGGVIVRVGTLRGFVPGSQLASSRSARDASESSDPNRRWEAVVGESLCLRVIEADKERNRLILSERAAVSGAQKRERDQLLEQLTEGDVVKGRVTSVVDFGAFVDLGAVDGLVHISELSWERVAHPRDVVQVGDEVDVYVLRVDTQRGRVALSMRKLQPDPWETIGERYEEGQLLEAVVTRITDWGAFARLVDDEAIEGLIHISELDDVAVAHPREIVRSGQRLTLRVVDVDPERRRLGLSLKRVVQGELAEPGWESAVAPDGGEGETAISAALSEALGE